ncbi:membrane dipeptidase-domain-containing protein [Infundibulicybe gibba]|nr:membrane dipeptidase-domain-containing protein [Infundibulicybe gibba]
MSSRSSSSDSSSRHHIVATNGGLVGTVALLAVSERLLWSNMSSNGHNHEASPLLRSHSDSSSTQERQRQQTPCEADPKTRAAVWGTLTLFFVVALIVVLGFPNKLGEIFDPLLGKLPRDPMKAALVMMDQAPVIDGHIDLPILARWKYANNVSAIDLEADMPQHVDIPRLRKGKVGGFFWSVYVSCAHPDEEGEDFTFASWRVRDTLEQIDVAKLLIGKYPHTFQLALGTEDIKSAIMKGKVASLLGVEGGHQLGNSIAVLRQYHALGVRYVTLTHVCHNAFADSCGMLPGMIPLHGGLSPLGRTLIDEMNRLGVLVDLSHTSDATAMQALNYSRAPVIWSHSSARAVHNVPRNVPDFILKMIGSGEGQKDAVVMVNFSPGFVSSPGNATVKAVADHVEHIARVAGKKTRRLGKRF